MLEIQILILIFLLKFFVCLKGIIQSNQTLVLQRVSRNQSGIYQCEASNAQGNTISNKINLVIKYAPVCKDNYM